MRIGERVAHGKVSRSTFSVWRFNRLKACFLSDKCAVKHVPMANGFAQQVFYCWLEQKRRDGQQNEQIKLSNWLDVNRSLKRQLRNHLTFSFNSAMVRTTLLNFTAQRHSSINSDLFCQTIEMALFASHFMLTNCFRIVKHNMRIRR